MPIYEYQCRDCGAVEADVASMDASTRLVNLGCVQCGTGRLKRLFAFHPAPIMHEHFNQSVGKPISSMRQFKDELARMDERNTARNGIPHKSEACSLADLAPADMEG